MLTGDSFDYAVIRVVPRVERCEFINCGAIVYCRTRRYLASAIDLDRDRLRVLASSVDVEEVERHLAVIPLICAGGDASGPIGRLAMAERFHWLVSPRSTLVQPSPVHCGICRDPETALRDVLDRMVRRID